MSQKHLDEVKAAAARYIQDTVATDRRSASDFERARNVLINVVFGACAGPARARNALQPISKLPVDLFVRVASLLPVRALCAAMAVSSDWNAVIARTPVLWASATIPFSYNNCRSSHALRTIGTRSDGAPLALHLVSTDGPDEPVEDKDSLCKCQRELAQLVQRVKLLSILGDPGFWYYALSQAVPKLEVLHIGSQRGNRRHTRGENMAFPHRFAVRAPMLREVHLVGYNPHFASAMVFPMVRKVYLSGTDTALSLGRLFKSFSNMEELYLLGLNGEVFDQESDSEPESASPLLIVPSALRRVFVSADVGPKFITSGFHEISDRVVSMVPRSVWHSDSSVQLRMNIDTLVPLGHPESLEMGWHAIASELVDYRDPLNVDRWFLYLSVEGRCLAVDIHSYRFNRMLRSWAAVSSTNFDLVRMLNVPVNVWHRMMMVGLMLPHLRELRLTIGFICCWEGENPEKNGLLRDDDRNQTILDIWGSAASDSNELDLDQFIEPDDVQSGEEEDLSDFIVDEDESMHAPHVAAEDASLREHDYVTDIVASDARAPSSPEGGIDADRHESQQSSQSRRLKLSHLCRIPAPEEPLRLEVLRIEGSDHAVDEIVGEDVAQFLQRLLETGHMLERLELGGGLRLVEPKLDEVRAASRAITMDHRRVQLPEATRPWYWVSDNYFAGDGHETTS